MKGGIECRDLRDLWLCALKCLDKREFGWQVVRRERDQPTELSDDLSSDPFGVMIARSPMNNPVTDGGERCVARVRVDPFKQPSDLR